MKVKAENLTIDSIFKKWKFNIPNYQREYDWEISHVEQLLYDITENDINYFIWHMVFEWAFSWNNFDVIDWQQRITTIVIILSVIRDLFYSLWDDNLALWVNNYIFSKDLDNKDFVILTNEMPYPIFQKYVQSIPWNKIENPTPSNEWEKKIINIYDYLRDYFTWYTIEDLKSFRDKILKLEVIFVSVEEWDSFSIFSTLNATWKDLTPLDLIKNQIFKWYPVEAHINEPHDTWKTLLSNVKDNKKFLNYFWASRYKKVSDWKIFLEFKKEVIDKQLDLKVFLNDLYNDSEIFELINKPQESDWASDELKVFMSLNALNIFSIKVTYSILISLIRAYKKWIIAKKWLIKSLTVIEKFHFINNAIASLRSSWLDQMYSKYAKKIYNSIDKQEANLVISDMKKELEDRIPNLKDFYDNSFELRTVFTNSNTKNKRLINYILKKIELKEQNYNISINDVSLEHIIPQSNWNDWIIWKIWNIVILDRDFNSSLWNKDFNTKKTKILEKSTIISTMKVFQQFNNFSEVEINNRTNEIKEYMFENIW